MKSLPEEISMQRTLFASLAKGGHMQQMFNEEFQVTFTAIQPERGKEWRYEWTHPKVPTVCESYQQLCREYDKIIKHT
jgi:hypothetical protein